LANWVRAAPVNAEQRLLKFGASVSDMKNCINLNDVFIDDTTLFKRIQVRDQIFKDYCTFITVLRGIACLPVGRDRAVNPNWPKHKPS